MLNILPRTQLENMAKTSKVKKKVSKSKIKSVSKTKAKKVIKNKDIISEVADTITNVC